MKQHKIKLIKKKSKLRRHQIAYQWLKTKLILKLIRSRIVKQNFNSKIKIWK